MDISPLGKGNIPCFFLTFLYSSLKFSPVSNLSREKKKDRNQF